MKPLTLINVDSYVRPTVNLQHGTCRDIKEVLHRIGVAVFKVC
jgi:hypothetical protein